MSKPIKVVLSVIALLIAIPIIAVIVASQVIDTDDIKQLVTDQATKQTGRTLTIDGDIGLGFFPWLSVDIGKTRLENAPGFGSDPLFEVDQISVSLKIIPLLSGNVELDTVTLTGLNLDLHTNAEGISNFADIGGESAPTSAPTAGDSPADLDSAALAAFSIGGLAIEDARIRWRDQTSQTDIELSDFSLRSGAITPGQAVDISLGASIQLAEPALESRIDSSITVDIDDDFNRVAFSDLLIKLTATGKTLPGGEVTGQLSASAIANLADDTLMVEKMTLSAAGLEVNGDLSVTQMSQDPQAKVTLELESFNAHKVLAALAPPGIATADPDALTDINAAITLSANGSRMDLQQLAIQLDQTNITGEATVVDFDNPAISFKLAIDAIDLDRYLPGDASATTASDSSDETSSEEPINLGESLAGLAALNLKGSLTIGKLKVSNLQSSDISLTVNAENGRLQLDPISANLYDGSLNGSVDVNGSVKPPALALSQKLTNVNLSPLIMDAAGVDQVSGKASIEAIVSTRGNAETELTQNLDGTLRFDITDGTLKGINVDRSACLAMKGIKSLSGKENNETCPPDEPTRFNFFRASAKVTDGVLNNRDLFIEQQRSDPEKFLHIKGSGKVDLTQQLVNYRVTAARVEKLADNNYRTSGTAIPVKISGDLTAPSVQPDVSGLVKAEAKSKLKEKLAPKLAPSEDDSESDQLKKQLLRGLFN